MAFIRLFLPYKQLPSRMHACTVEGLACWKVLAAPIPTLVTPHIAVPAAVSTLRFSALPAEPTKGVAIAWWRADMMRQWHASVMVHSPC